MDGTCACTKPTTRCAKRTELLSTESCMDGHARRQAQNVTRALNICWVWVRLPVKHGAPPLLAISARCALPVCALRNTRHAHEFSAQRVGSGCWRMQVWQFEPHCLHHAKGSVLASIRAAAAPSARGKLCDHQIHRAAKGCAVAAVGFHGLAGQKVSALAGGQVRSYQSAGKSVLARRL